MISLIARFLAPDHIAIADGGEFLSFARVGLSSDSYLDAGVFGCLGFGVPFANAAGLLHPDRQVICLTGDGAYGIKAMQIDTAVRHGCRAEYVVEQSSVEHRAVRQDVNYGGRVVGTEFRDSDYAAA